MTPDAIPILLPGIVAVSIVLMLIRPRGIAEVWWICGGALLLLALRKEKIKVGFWKFFKVGAIAMPVALFAALGGAILMHTLLGR
jgi:Na+/H+ antiporter NhaD/arsenite permease-like protein